MLRRRPDATFEFRLVEAAFAAAAPAPLSPERREALRLRIFANLGPQDFPRRLLPTAPGFVRERWVAIPAGVGIAAAIIAANRVVLEFSQPATRSGDLVARASGEVLVDGQAGVSAVAGQRIEARTSAWLALPGGGQAGLEAGAVVRFTGSGASLALLIESGDVTVVTGDAGLAVAGQGWSASVQASTVARFVPMGDAMIVHVPEGLVQLTIGGRSYTITPADSPLFIPGASGQPAGDEGGAAEPEPPPGSADGDGPGAPDSPGFSRNEESGHPGPPSDSPGQGNLGNGNPPSDPPGQGNPGDGGPPSDPPGQGNGGNGGPPSDPPGQGNGGNGNPPSDPPGQGHGGNGGPPSDPPGQGNGGNGGPPSDPPGQGNGGNGGPPSDPPGQGNGGIGGPPSDPPGQGNGGNGGPPSDPPGQGNGGNGGPPEDPPGQGNGGNGGPPSDPPGQGNGGNGGGKK